MPNYKFYPAKKIGGLRASYAYSKFRFLSYNLNLNSA